MSEEDARQKPGLYGEYEIVERLAAIATFPQPISVLEQVGRIWFSAEVDAWVEGLLGGPDYPVREAG